MATTNEIYDVTGKERGWVDYTELAKIITEELNND